MLEFGFFFSGVFLQSITLNSPMIKFPTRARSIMTPMKCQKEENVICKKSFMFLGFVKNNWVKDSRVRLVNVIF